ncbi:MAG: hypothetical protein A3E57_03380 [Candidatus Muproteobacteria bacterium RIFCSPHIGHO2_12_FULL_60_33]|uniref:Histidine kinase/HSP90-like ATPase domain-containing protein n=1 Tax=Candidatus Muproteobacteria bacterium RIFCSPLOWO2_01_FULL_60_18 TaxID=1817768 RepID=A0A1F6U1B8_9PROT|nr:MAG: hypothetical protein A2W42_03675 [Candidatus Muproteobacteria bacterium RIFCSPHIGHO2_01_60_12]OGI51151.1 MAG: hypothetical protein A3A87_03245 [Candidatus Muproteobacteria bacterium RIFCSPLOWO2_01_FULL_60_18]OGI53581.1 MAG: hypothetical protein A3E57_03380 [Candidatus Muproteobacteria bacterium RIFCSPHIGHO2_12_FULL_60_33]OGI55644.1 MAG: hypothetical protein A3D32_03805 [Candidatus Muproteobacteria bacterium RIFCSPHIGHO2_02_FULL_60_13]OGI58038.1 MAG: hypothetical protein A2809_03665 [Can
MDTGERMIELRFPAQASRLKLLRSVVHDVALLCGGSDETAGKVVLAVNEACMNVIQHAYRNDPSGEISVELLNKHGRLVVRVRDFAPAVDPATVRSRALEDIRPGGLGVHLINEVMDEARFLPPPDGVGNLFEMTKKLA